MPVTAVGFDLDYTLVIPNQDREKLLKELSSCYDIPQISREEYLSAHQNHLDKRTRKPVFSEIFERRGIPVDAQDVAGSYRSLVNSSLVVIPGAKELLDSLSSKYKLGLLTNGPSRAQREKISQLGLEEYFDTIIISGDLHAGKPDQVAFASLLSELNAPASETVYVGDDPSADISGGKNAGLRVIQICYPDGPAPNSLADAHIRRERLVETLPELLSDLDP